MINNGSLHYDHDRDGTHTQLAGCEAKFRNLDHDTHISIRYERDTLTVSTDIENKAAWKECFQVKGVQLPTGYFIGASATTGDLSDNHDIISIRLFELDMPDDVNFVSNIIEFDEYFNFFRPTIHKIVPILCHQQHSLNHHATMSMIQNRVHCPVLKYSY